MDEEDIGLRGRGWIPSDFQEKRAATGDFGEDDVTLGLPAVKRTGLDDVGEEDLMWMKRTLDFKEKRTTTGDFGEEDMTLGLPVVKRFEPSGFQEKITTTGDFDEDDGTLGLPAVKRTLDYGEGNGFHWTSRRRRRQPATLVKRIRPWDLGEEDGIVGVPGEEGYDWRLR